VITCRITATTARPAARPPNAAVRAGAATAMRRTTALTTSTIAITSPHPNGGLTWPIFQS